MNKNYDVEAVAKAAYERQKSWMPDLKKWEEIESYAQTNWRAIVKDVVICYEQHLEQQEAEAKKAEKKKGKQ